MVRVEVPIDKSDLHNPRFNPIADTLPCLSWPMGAPPPARSSRTELRPRRLPIPRHPGSPPSLSNRPEGGAPTKPHIPLWERRPGAIITNRTRNPAACRFPVTPDAPDSSAIAPRAGSTKPPSPASIPLWERRPGAIITNRTRNPAACRFPVTPDAPDSSAIAPRAGLPQSLLLRSKHHIPLWERRPGAIITNRTRNPAACRFPVTPDAPDSSAIAPRAGLPQAARRPPQSPHPTSC